MPFDIVKRIVDAVQHHNQVRGGTGGCSCGVQNQITHGLVEIFALLGYHPYGSGIDGEYQRICQFDMFPFDDLLIEIFKHRFVVGYSVADPLIGGMNIQRSA